MMVWKRIFQNILGRAENSFVSFSFAYLNQELSTAQKKALIKLIEKW